jgi:hypothetical protein
MGRLTAGKYNPKDGLRELLSVPYPTLDLLAMPKSADGILIKFST